MKRIKVMLTAVTILAVVGGALAFKAQKFNGICAYTAGTSGACAATFENSTTAALGSALSFVTTRSKVSDVCPALPSDCTVKGVIGEE